LALAARAATVSRWSRANKDDTALVSLTTRAHSGLIKIANDRITVPRGRAAFSPAIVPAVAMDGSARVRPSLKIP
jgi:hypothetical protein